MSSQQTKDVFRHCFALAKDLEAQPGRKAEALAVLRALQVYLDIFPAMPDGSCRNMTMGLIQRLSEQVPRDV